MKTRRSSEEVMSLVQQVDNMVNQGKFAVKQACLEVGISSAVYYTNYRKLSGTSKADEAKAEARRKVAREAYHAKKNGRAAKPITATAQPGTPLNYCPSCGCHLRAVNVALNLPTS